MSELLPSGWKKRALGDVLGRRAERADGSEPLLSVTQKRGVIPQDEVGRRDSSSEYKGNYWRVYPGDIVYNTMRMWQGVSGVSGQHGIVSPAYTVCKPAADVDSKFLAYLLRKPSVVNKFYRMSQGLVSDTWNLRYAEFSRIPVSLPPLGEQRRVAEILDALDEQINCERRLADKLQSVSLGVIESIFDGMVDGPVRGLVSNEDRRQEECALGDLGTWLSGGTPSTSDPGFWGGEIPWISAASMKDFYISDSDRKVTQSGASAGTRLVPSGTVLFVVRGMSLKKEFRVGVTVREVAFGQDCKAIIPRDDIDGTFLALALRAKSQLVLRMVDEAGHGTGRLPTDAIAKMRITVPPFTAQRRIVDTVQAFDRRLNAQMVTLEKLLLLRQGLAEDLLTGRVRVPEAEAVVESL